MNSVSPDDHLPEFLSTIRIPENLKQLKDTLPRANYTPLKLQQEEKESFLKSIEQRYPGATKAKGQLIAGNHKESGLGRRLGPLHRGEALAAYPQPQKDSSASLINRSVEGLPHSKLVAINSSLPHLGKRPLNSLEMKLKYLNRKKVEDLYQRESALGGDGKSLKALSTANLQHYESVLGGAKQ